MNWIRNEVKQIKDELFSERPTHRSNYESSVYENVTAKLIVKEMKSLTARDDAEAQLSRGVNRRVSE